jgi:Bifunctional DNA primase/polymerase, N-terminal
MSGQDQRLLAGLGYIDRGWQPFVLSSSKTPVANCEPCKADHTTPAQMEACACLTCHGFHAATADPDRLAEMLRLHPRGLLAVRTGAPSGVVVIDVDPPGIGTMRMLVGEGVLPRTLAAVTGRGGYHLIYAHPGGKIMSGAGKGGPGIDVKADGGYIVAAPSIHPSTRRPYRWLGSPGDELAPLPQFWAGRLRESTRPPRPAQAVSIPARGRGGYAHAALRYELEEVLSAGEGTRNTTLHLAAWNLGQLVASGMLEADRTEGLLCQAAERVGLPAAEARRTVASGFRAAAQYPRGGVA